MAGAASGEGRPGAKDARAAPRAMPPPLVRTRARSTPRWSRQPDASAEVSSDVGPARARTRTLAERVGSVASTSRAPSRRSAGVRPGGAGPDRGRQGARSRHGGGARARLRHHPVHPHRVRAPQPVRRRAARGRHPGRGHQPPCARVGQTARLVVVPWSSWSSRRGAKRGEGVEGGDGPPRPRRRAGGVEKPGFPPVRARAPERQPVVVHPRRRGGGRGARRRQRAVPLHPRAGGDQAVSGVLGARVLRQALQRLQLPRPGRAAELGVPGGERVGAQRWARGAGGGVGSWRSTRAWRWRRSRRTR